MYMSKGTLEFDSKKTLFTFLTLKTRLTNNVHRGNSLTFRDKISPTRRNVRVVGADSLGQIDIGTVVNPYSDKK